MPGREAPVGKRHPRLESVARATAGLSRPVSLATIIGLFAAVTALRWFFDSAGQAVALLYVVPIALSAFRFPRRGGTITAAVGAVGFTVLAAVHGRGDLDISGWLGPVIAMALVGYLADLAAHRERLVRLHLEQNRRLTEVRDAQRAALNASDSLVQQVAVARWMLEAGRTQQALDVLGGTVAESIPYLSAGLSHSDEHPTDA